jgi:hypothetical protein
MNLLAIEINDAGLTGATGNGIVFETEGFAWLGEGRAQFGADAFARARLEPDCISSRHWQVLDQTPLARPLQTYRTHADVVFAHLEALWQANGEGIAQVVFALPGSYGREQLGLLLGMCGRLSIPVAGFVDAALAATRRSYPGAELVHLELCLHRAVLSHLDQGARLRRSRVEERDQVGIVNVREILVKAIAAEFVRELRFDPLHRADSEQQLYQQLPDLSAALQDQGPVEIVLDAAAGIHRLSIGPQLLDRALSPIVGSLCEFVAGQHFANVPMVVELSATAIQIPGLATALRSHGHPVVCLEPGAGALGALALADELPSGSAVFLSEAPLPDLADLPAVERSSSGVQKIPEPSHLLYLDHAYPLGAKPLVIGREGAPGSVDILLRDPPQGVSRRHCSVAIREGIVVVEDNSTYGTWVNEVPVIGRARLRLGDSIQLGNTGIELKLIHVESGER